jgi:hypothetical protein
MENKMNKKGEGNLLVKSLIALFLIGGMIAFIMSGYINFNEIEEKEYISPFVIFSGAIIDVISFPLTFISGATEYAFGTFGILFGDSDSLDALEIPLIVEGTGQYNGRTLDGEYSFKTNILSSDYVLFQNEDFSSEIRFYYDEDLNPEKIELRSMKFMSSWRRFFVSFTGQELIYTGTDFEEMSFPIQLNQTEYSFNENAYISIDINIEELEKVGIRKGFTPKIKEFFSEIKEYVQNAVRTFGFLPEEIGIPLIIILLVMMFYSIWKLIPFT